jgi:hypothetical protein
MERGTLKCKYSIVSIDKQSDKVKHIHLECNPNCCHECDELMEKWEVVEWDANHMRISRETAFKKWDKRKSNNGR